MWKKWSKFKKQLITKDIISKEVKLIAYQLKLMHDYNFSVCVDEFAIHTPNVTIEYDKKDLMLSIDDFSNKYIFPALMKLKHD